MFRNDGKIPEKTIIRNVGITLIVVLLLANGALLYYPNVRRSYVNGRFTDCQGNCKNIGTALEMYAADNGGEYPRNLSKLIPDYLTTMPTCMEAGKDTYSKSYRRNLKGDYYRFYCEGLNHRDLEIARDYPQYNSRDGLIARDNGGDPISDRFQGD